MKTCIRCKTQKPLSNFENHPTAKDGKRNQCTSCRYQIRLDRDPNYRSKQRDWNLGRYGITSLEYDEILSSQNNLCAICKRETKLVVDHCHSSKTIRGLLCNNCNTALGLLGDDLERIQAAAQYLTRFSDQEHPAQL